VGKPVDSLNLNPPLFEVIESRDLVKAPGKDNQKGKFSKEEFADKRIIHAGMNDVDILTAFRELRTTILPKLSSFNSILQVSSAYSGGGASFSAINLAVSCTFEHHRHALLVDCNFEKPSLASTLDIEADAGLFDFLTDRVSDIGDIIYPTNIPRLSVVPTGEIQSEDHIEFFTGENMRIFLEDVRNRYDDRIIIIDAPPLLDSADAKILAEVTDSVLLVIPYKGAGPSKLNKMIKAAGKDKVVGVVLNN